VVIIADRSFSLLSEEMIMIVAIVVANSSSGR